MNNDFLLAVIAAVILFAATAATGLYYWYQFVQLCPTGC